MTKRIRAKSKLERRLGENLWGRPKSPAKQASLSAGVSTGNAVASRLITVFSCQGKQKLRGYYGNIGERQFRRYYQEAVRRKGDTGAHFG